MSVIFYAYPLYKSYQCIESAAEADVRLIKHWLSFWLFSGMLDQLTFLPFWMKLPFVVLLYFPDVTEWNRLLLSTLIPKALIIIDTYRKKLITNDQIMTSTGGFLSKARAAVSNVLSGFLTAGGTKTE